MFVKNQNKEICLAAINKYNNALRFVKNQDKEICLIAAKGDLNCLKHINTKNKRLLLHIIKIHGHRHQFTRINKQSINILNLILRFKKYILPKIK